MATSARRVAPPARRRDRLPVSVQAPPLRRRRFELIRILDWETPRKERIKNLPMGILDLGPGLKSGGGMDFMCVRKRKGKVWRHGGPMAHVEAPVDSGRRELTLPEKVHKLLQGSRQDVRRQ